MTTNIKEIMAKAATTIEEMTEMSVETFNYSVKESFPATHYDRMVIDGKEYNVDITITIH